LVSGVARDLVSEPRHDQIEQRTQACQPLEVALPDRLLERAKAASHRRLEAHAGEGKIVVEIGE
jgi:hypothetical protein